MTLVSHQRVRTKLRSGIRLFSTRLNLYSLLSTLDAKNMRSRSLRGSRWSSTSCGGQQLMRLQPPDRASVLAYLRILSKKREAVPANVERCGPGTAIVLVHVLDRLPVVLQHKANVVSFGFI